MQTSMTNSYTYDHLSSAGRKLQQIQRTNMWKPYLTEGVQKRFIPNPNKFKVIWAKQESRQSSYLALLEVIYYDGIHVRPHWILSRVFWAMSLHLKDFIFWTLEHYGLRLVNDGFARDARSFQDFGSAEFPYGCKARPEILNFILMTKFLLEIVILI